jgi:hypothetical protein
LPIETAPIISESDTSAQSPERSGVSHVTADVDVNSAGVVARSPHAQ